MAANVILLSVTNAVATITLNRLDKLNAYNMAMRDGMWAALSTVRDAPDVRAVILRGAGEKAFCVGADLSEFGSNPSQVSARQVRFERDVWGLWKSIRKPFVAALHGFVLGSGIEMALWCDLRVAADDCVFALPEVQLGMIPAAGGTQTLPRAIRPGVAMDLLLRCERITAREALRVGLVHRVVPRARVLAEAESAARRLAALPEGVACYVKESLARGADMPLRDALALERRLAARCLERDISQNVTF